MKIWYTITGAIDTNTAHQLITWVNQQCYNSQIEQLTVFISSNGGDMDSAIRMYAYLKGLPSDVETIGFSQVDSAANTLYLAGADRKALLGCRFFLHEGSFTIGNPTALLHAHEETLTLLKELLKRNAEIISEETGKDTEKVLSILKEGKILTTKEAKSFGIVHEIIEKLPSGPNIQNDNSSP